MTAGFVLPPAANTNVDQDGTAEFVCVDCGDHVTSVCHAGQTERCMMCKFIADIPDEAGRAAIRKWKRDLELR